VCRAVQLAAILARHLERTGRLTEGAILHEGACAAAGDPAGRAGALVNLGNVRWLSGNYARAAEAFRAAGTLARACGDLVVEARANANLGRTYFRWGRYEEAETCHRLA
jgi:tetratricopeptide (TPR) repeat protein